MKKSCILISLSLTITIASCKKENLNSVGNDQIQFLTTKTDSIPNIDPPKPQVPGERVDPNGEN